MKYWPKTAIACSTRLSPGHALEWMRADNVCPSKDAYLAAVDVARHTEAVDAPNLFFVESTNAPVRRMYVNYPGLEEWLKLERTCLIEDDAGFLFGMVDGLH